jgi:hypothetical protein
MMQTPGEPSAARRPCLFTATGAAGGAGHGYWRLCCCQALTAVEHYTAASSTQLFTSASLVTDCNDDACRLFCLCCSPAAYYGSVCTPRINSQALHAPMGVDKATGGTTYLIPTSRSVTADKQSCIFVYAGEHVAQSSTQPSAAPRAITSCIPRSKTQLASTVPPAFCLNRPAAQLRGSACHALHLT